MEKNRKIRNICWKCKNWEECYKYRYGNKQQEYMEKIHIEKDSYGQNVIYVGKCSKYSYEDPEIPKNPIFMYTNFEEN